MLAGDLQFVLSSWSMLTQKPTLRRKWCALSFYDTRLESFLWRQNGVVLTTTPGSESSGHCDWFLSYVEINMTHFGPRHKWVCRANDTSYTLKHSMLSPGGLHYFQSILCRPVWYFCLLIIVLYIIFPSCSSGHYINYWICGTHRQKDIEVKFFF